MAEKTLATEQERNLAQSEQGVPSTREDTRFLIPPVDIYEEEEGLTVVADMPGVAKDALDVRVDDGLLTISGTVAQDVVGEPLLAEYQLLNFHRQFQLSEQVDVDKISAKLNHGVLTLKLPKIEAAKPKQISVQVD